MNIFLLDVNPTLAAQYLCDKHIVKQCLETAQILSTVQGGPYRPTHQRHPCVLWAAKNKTNFYWLKRHGIALCEEYTYRYGKHHKSEPIIRAATDPALPIGISQFVQCMPEKYRNKDPVQAYRRYYYEDKRHFAHWTRREAPFWWGDPEGI